MEKEKLSELNWQTFQGRKLLKMFEMTIDIQNEITRLMGEMSTKCDNLPWALGELLLDTKKVLENIEKVQARLDIIQVRISENKQLICEDLFVNLWESMTEQNNVARLGMENLHEVLMRMKEKEGI